MTDEDSEGVPRRNILYLGGSTLLATGISVWWNWDNVKSILAGRDEPFGGATEQSPTGTPAEEPSEENPENYGDWRDGIPSGCELPSSYAEDVESYIDEDVEDMDSSMMDQYVDSGRVAFEKDGTELGLLVDQDNDGQYDDSYSGNFEDLCT